MEMWSNRSSADTSRLAFTRDSHYTTLPPLNPLPPFTSWPTKCKEQVEGQSTVKHCQLKNPKNAMVGNYEVWEAPALKDPRFERHRDSHFSVSRSIPPSSGDFSQGDLKLAPTRVLSLPKLGGQVLQSLHGSQLTPTYDHQRPADCIRHKSYSSSLQPPETPSYLNKNGADLQRSRSDFLADKRAGFMSQSHLQYPQPRLCIGSPLNCRTDNFHNFVAASPKSHSIKSKKLKVVKPSKDAHLKKPSRSMSSSAAKVNYAIKPASTGELPYTALRIANAIYPTIVEKKYSAPVLDPRNPSLYVFEYPIGDHWVIWNYCTGMVHLTGLWRAAIQEGIYGMENYSLQQCSNLAPENKPSVEHGDFPQQRIMRILIKPNAKADIAKLLESTPRSLQSCIKRVRGGFLKIQGTWITYPLCKILATRFAYYIRYHLVPIFGADFPGLCLPPSDPNFGELEFNSDILQLVQFGTPPLPSMPISPPIMPQSQSKIEAKPRTSVPNDATPSQMTFYKTPSCLPDSVSLETPVSPLDTTFDQKIEKKVIAGCDYLVERQNVGSGSALNANTQEVMKIASLLT